jgi:hypothetical protein
MSAKNVPERFQDDGMEEVYFPDINRTAIIVKLKKPFIDWVLYTSKEHDGKDCVLEGEIPTEGFDSKRIYLMPVFDENDDFEKYLKKHYRDIFEHELCGWYLDTAWWPQDRSWKVFQEWFDCEMHSMVYDMSDEDLEHES